MRRDQLNPHKTATYVMERHKAVYVSVNKAACTSLKWLVADLQGEDPERFHRSLSREVARPMTIHRRSMFRHTPMLHQLPDAELAGIGPDQGWFVFAVTRHPSARFFSGWQSKFLLREPRFMHEHGAEAWIPRVPARTQDVVDEFERFAVAMAEAPDQRVMRDRHFLSQVTMLAPDRFPYTRIYDTREIPQLLADLDDHLRALGHSGEPPTLMQSNETPLLPLERMFTPAVRAALESLYADDFATFGYQGLVPPKADPAQEYAPTLLAEVGRLIDRHERIGDLALRAQSLNARAKRAKRGKHPAASRTSPARRLSVPADGVRWVRGLVRRLARR